MQRFIMWPGPSNPRICYPAMTGSPAFQCCRQARARNILSLLIPHIGHAVARAFSLLTQCSIRSVRIWTIYLAFAIIPFAPRWFELCRGMNANVGIGLPDRVRHTCRDERGGRAVKRKPFSDPDPGAGPIHALLCLMAVLSSRNASLDSASVGPWRRAS